MDGSRCLKKRRLNAVDDTKHCRPATGKGAQKHKDVIGGQAPARTRTGPLAASAKGGTNRGSRDEAKEEATPMKINGFQRPLAPCHRPETSHSARGSRFGPNQWKPWVFTIFSTEFLLESGGCHRHWPDEVWFASSLISTGFWQNGNRKSCHRLIDILVFFYRVQQEKSSMK